MTGPIDGRDKLDERDEREVARALDELGGRAVGEAGPAPSLGPTARPRRRMLVAAAAALLLVAGAASVVLVTQDDGPDTVVAAPDDPDAAPTGWPDENIVLMEFSPDPAPPSDTLDVVITNRTDIPWSFECRTGGLLRWDGKAWETISRSVMWSGDRLTMFEGDTTLDCGPPTEFVAPGATDRRTLDPSSVITMGRGDGPEGTPAPLGPGTYQLLFVDQMEFTGAWGNFELSE